jgi:hypothetical protein
VYERYRVSRGFEECATNTIFNPVRIVYFVHPHSLKHPMKSTHIDIDEICMRWAKSEAACQGIHHKADEELWAPTVFLGAYNE